MHALKKLNATEDSFFTNQYNILLFSKKAHRHKTKHTMLALSDKWSTFLIINHNKLVQIQQVRTRGVYYGYLG